MMKKNISKYSRRVPCAYKGVTWPSVQRHGVHAQMQKKLYRSYMAERDPTRMETASVTSIIVTPHFIVSNGNGVVTGDTVIGLITRY